jgi:hypothetical protein
LAGCGTRYGDVPGVLGNAPDDRVSERRGTPKYKHLLEFNGRVTPACVRSAAPPLMAGMNLGMSERNDTMAAHRSVVAGRNSNWAEDKNNRGRHDFHASRTELTRRPLTGAAGVIAAATHTLLPFSPKAVVGMAIYTAKAKLHGEGTDRWEMLGENVP